MKSLSAFLAAILFASPALADWTGKDASNTTITFKNTSTCSSVVCVVQTSIVDPTGANGVAAPTAGADTSSNTATGLQIYSRPSWFNGTTWDRAAGDATNGAWVNVKTGTVAVTQSTSSNLKAQVDPLTIASWGLMSGTVPGTAPTNTMIGGGIFNSSAPAPTTGQTLPLQQDQAGNQRVMAGTATASLSAWNNATGLNATQNIFTNSGASAVEIQLTQTTTIAGGAITYEVSWDAGSTWVTIPADAVLDPTATSPTQISLPYTLQVNTNKQFLIVNKGWDGLRIKLSTQITGTGTVTPSYTMMSNPIWPSLTAYLGAALPAGSNIIGKVGIDQTTPGTTNGVQVNAALPAGGNTIGAVTQASGPWTVNQTQYNSTAVVANPCLTGTITSVAISQATSTQILSQASAKKNYLCSIAVNGSDAENLSLVEGTGSVCGTSTAAIIGGTTAANGMNLIAGGGITLGNGAAPVAAGANNNFNVCLLQSGAGRVAGVAMFAQQ